jgi:PAS domain S-box-containing protein
MVTLSGKWEWDLHASAVFCSDVMLALPPPFEGTLGLIHPDDALLVKEKLLQPGTINGLSFRIITTYGEVHTLTGEDLEKEEAVEEPEPRESLFQHTLLVQGEKHEKEHLYLKSKSAEFSERITRSGAWYINTTTNETWYSDNVFRIYGLPAQSLNAHPNTFSAFMHPDDRSQVEEAFDRAYREQLPLHLRFRILAGDEVRFVSQATHWSNTSTGQVILHGIIEDVTEQVLQEDSLELALQDTEFQKQLLLFSEQSVQIGFWQVNLVTRKTECSNNYYRIFGLKPNVLPGAQKFLINYVHPDDREMVEEADRKLRTEQTAQETEFRIIRPDGKTRYLRQQGKVLLYGGEPIMVGIIQDITTQKLLEKKLAEHEESVAVRNFINWQAEEMTGIGSWSLELDTGRVSWSENFYHMLGYKPNSVEITQRHLLRLVHPEDRKKFTDTMTLARETEQGISLEFRLAHLGVIQHMKGVFRLMRREQKEILIVTIQDITQEYQMKHELHRRAYLAGSLMDNILDRVVITDTDNNILLWNKRCEEAYGIRKDKAIGRNFFDVMPGLRTPEEIALFNRALAGEAVHQPSRQSAARREFLDLHMLPLRDEEGMVTGVLHVTHDITREFELNQNLAERLSFIEKLVESSVDQIIVLDRNMNYLYWNKKSEERYGLSQKEVVGRNVLEVFPNSPDNPSYEDFRKALQGETVYIPGREDQQQGSYREVYLIPIKNEKGEVASVLWITHDLTNEYLLRLEQQRGARLMNSISEAYIELDRDHVFRYINRRAEELWKIDREDWLGKNIGPFMEQLMEPESAAIVAEALQSNNPSQGEYYCHSAEDWLYLSATPTAEGLIILFYDITEIMETREKLNREHRRLKEAQAVGRLGSFEWERETNRITWSDELYRIYGLEPQSEEITIEKILAWTHPEDLDLFKKEMEQVRGKAGTHEYSHRIQLPDGTVRYVNRRTDSAINEEGVIYRLYGTAQDITEFKKAEEEIKQGKDLLQSVFDASALAFAVFRIIYGEDGEPKDLEFLYINQVSRNFIGGDDPIGRRFLEVMPYATQSDIPGVYMEVARTGKPADVERSYAKEGHRRWFRITAQKLHDVLISSMEDFTGKKMAEMEKFKHYKILEQSEEVAGMGSWEYDIATGACNWSEGMYRLFGLPKDAPIHPEIYLEYAARLSKPTARRIVNHLQKEFTSFEEVLEMEKDGIRKMLRIKGTVIHNKNGEPEKLLGVDLDVTAAWIAEEKINETLRKLGLQNSVYEYAEDIARVGTWSWSLDASPIAYSDNMFLLFGMEPGQADTDFLTFKEFVHPDDLDSLMRMSMDIREDDEPRAVEYRVTRRDGAKRIFRNRCKLIRHQRTGERMLIGITQDITEEHELRGKLLERTVYAESLIDASVDRMFVLDRHLVIHAWNRKCEEYYGRKRETMLGRPLPEAFPGMAENEGMMLGIQRAFNGGHSFMPATREACMTVVTEFFFIPLKNEEGETHSVLCVLHDVTRAYDAQAKLEELNKSLEQKNRELERKNEEITAFAFVASHDLKEPLRKIHTFSDWLQEREGNSLSGQGKQYLDKIGAAVRRMDLLIEDILVLTRIHSDTRHTGEVSLDAVLAEVTTEMKDLITSSGAEIEAGDLGSVRGNASQVANLFQNLLDNSIKFRKPGATPKITISSSLVKAPHPSLPEAEEGREYLELCFSDNGIGFDQKYERKVFKMFQRIHYTHQSAGTGMGLAICKKIMSNHEGFITVKSSVDEGAVFCCYFPVES